MATRACAAVAPSPKPEHRGRWICFRPHLFYDSVVSGFEHDPPAPRACGTFGAWLFCQVFVHASLARQRWLVRVGFVDALKEGGDVFWRWRFWESHMRAELERRERAQWERRRSEAIARWGEGAG